MTATGISGPSARKRRGRPLAENTLAIREAIFALPERFERMTVRGIFYELESKYGVVPKDDNRGYRPVQRQVLVMRREGLLPWEFVADGTRWVRRAPTFDSVDDALREMSRSYRRDLWESQDWRIEVWLEKDALADLIWPTADRWGVPLLVSRGCTSVTFLYSAARDASEVRARQGRTTLVFALYDYDAGGARAFRKIQRGLEEYAPGCALVRQLALTREQVMEWDLPTRPAKKRDPEAKKWGDVAVELDAIPAPVLIALLDDTIQGLVDERAWKVAQVVEAEERAGLTSLLEKRSG